jgi:hypothetical protein
MFLEAQQVERCCSGLQDNQYSNHFLSITLSQLQQGTQTPSCKIHSPSSGATSQGVLAAVLRGDPNTACCTAKQYGSCLQHMQVWVQGKGTSFLSFTRCQNSLGSAPGKRARSFCDSCLKMASICSTGNTSLIFLSGLHGSGGHRRVMRHHHHQQLGHPTLRACDVQMGSSP